MFLLSDSCRPRLYKPDPNPRRKRMEQQEVIIKSVQIPFWDMVVLLIKFSIAVIPAAIIVAFLAVVVVGILRGLSGGA